MLLMKVSVIIIEIVALMTLSQQYHAISFLETLPTGVTMHNYALIKAAHDYVSKIHCVVYYIIILRGILNNMGMHLDTENQKSKVD